jgi:uncharacterized membrane protein YphA (DoxX/SURF4 family)
MLRTPASIAQGILARAALVLLRIYLGVVILLAGWPKVRGDLIPYSSPLVSLVGWGELLVGITLILGLVTRFSAAAALVLLLNNMVAKGAWYWTPSSSDAAFAVISVALLIGAAGRTVGLDGFLARRWPRSPFW